MRRVLTRLDSRTSFKLRDSVGIAFPRPFLTVVTLENLGHLQRVTSSTCTVLPSLYSTHKTGHCGQPISRRSFITWVADPKVIVAAIICIRCNVVPPSSLKILHPQNRFVSSVCSTIPSRPRLLCSHSYVDSHHLCTDAAALTTAVSEVAFLVQNRHSPYITFCRRLSVSRFVTEDTLQIQKYISNFDSTSCRLRTNRYTIAASVGNRPESTGWIPTTLEIWLVPPLLSA